MKRTPLRRKVPVKATNPERRAKLLAKNYGTRAFAVRAMPCLCVATRYEHTIGAVGCDGDIVAAHARSRGAGGDRRGLVPLCHLHHTRAGERSEVVGSERWDFEHTYGLDLIWHAARIAAELDELGHE